MNNDVITVEMIKKHLPDDIRIKQYVNMGANVFICTFPEKYGKDGNEQYTSFAVTISELEKNQHTAKQIDDLIEGRCKVGYKTGLAHHQKYVDRKH